MAILPRTLLTQPAPAAVAAVTLFGLTVMGTTAWKTAKMQQQATEHHDPCADVAASLTEQQVPWTEAAYLRMAACFEKQGDSAAIVQLAEKGLERYPRSEALYNLKGYHELVLTRHDDAVDTLEHGLVAVGQPTNGVMENNLAWAYLFVDDGDSDEARRLYEASLQREPNVCETIHTGLFVEYEHARASTGIARAEGLRNFQLLQRRYRSCENRDGEWNTVVESIGAAVVYREVAEMLDEGDRTRADLLSRRAVEEPVFDRLNFDADQFCSAEAMPLRHLQAECISEIGDAVRSASARASAERLHRRPSITD